jgi:predicted ATP-grasp superfamily ATP-dependent carboligase
MKIFVYELVTGGGLPGEPPPASLVHEADLMLRTLLDDLAEVPGLRVLTCRDPGLAPLPGVEALTPAGDDFLTSYDRGLASCDAAWPTAPETGGALELLARRTLDRDRVLLGCRPEAVRLAASKHATATVLGRAAIPVVPTFNSSRDLPPIAGPWIVKPDDGAGALGVRRVAGWREAAEQLDAGAGRWVAEPWVEGDARSLSLLCDGGRSLLLACNRQQVDIVDGVISLTGIDVNAVADQSGNLARLGSEIAAAIPSLWGYVGVDFIETAAGPIVVEINPRLTTSYCGLRRAIGANVAAMVLGLLDGRATWSAGTGSPQEVAPMLESGHE